ncbi:indole-3-glycerol phosphate synthase [Buchnera aphidicola (Nipponaphis monzeni)]|uniref:Multifunctional fusion protein n=1 Tax=Buchnera aphidicola (Nipponaphis monzeni) TaxID=2495405 RepID=A0A455TAB4_9GAMM|nr:bifunctional indole-3-glycerol-phosphate synthase TrpC/phosphoribosylanthranilate isomerase TrpF [Buchnera aphidicola]BBI01230.1 indole-3-glycerol phosphate synthase [Buchnera aphidicola (Nipponaphis monzeni)]
MNNIVLKKILQSKKEWIYNRKKTQPFNTFHYKISKTNKNFIDALQAVRPSYILEIKKASPSLGTIRKKFNIIEIVKVYNKYASAISVLTDSQYFQGDFNYLSIVRSNSNLPILCKDFIIDPYQIYLARYYQADAILLMLSVLNDCDYQHLASVAQTMNMNILTEVNNKKELKRAINLKCNIIGINNRNLNDLTIDMHKTKLMAPLLPKTTTIVSESGYSNYKYIRKFTKLVNSFLIGSHLMKQNDLNTAIKKIILGKNKICGLTKPEDSKISANAGAIYGGMIFVPTSPRYISLDIAKKIIKEKNLRYIGIFKDEEINLVIFYAINLNLYAVQLHGSENQLYINKLALKLPNTIHIWKSVGIKNKICLYAMNHVHKYIYDNNIGGSGKTFDWKLLVNKIPNNVLLAGGLNLNNCVTASYLGFSGLDFNSGVEITAGIKSAVKIFEVFKKLRYY